MKWAAKRVLWVPGRNAAFGYLSFRYCPTVSLKENRASQPFRESRFRAFKGVQGTGGCEKIDLAEISKFLV
jgi:hypothetical protein